MWFSPCRPRLPFSPLSLFKPNARIKRAHAHLLQVHAVGKPRASQQSRKAHRQCSKRQSHLYERRLLRMSWPPRTGLTVYGRTAHRSPCAHHRRLRALHSRAHRQYASVHKQSCLRSGRRRHLRFSEISAASASGQRHSTAQSITPWDTKSKNLSSVFVRKSGIVCWNYANLAGHSLQLFLEIAAPTFRQNL